MDKLKYVKLEKPDGSYSDNIPLAVDSDYVSVGSDILTNELNKKATKTEVTADINNLSNIISTKADKTELYNEIDTLTSELSTLASGSPAGVYTTVAALIAENPDHNKIYVVTENGHWYYYNNGWQDGGVYQSIEVEDKSIKFSNLTEQVQKNFYMKTLNTLTDFSNGNFNCIPFEFENGAIDLVTRSGISYYRGEDNSAAMKKTRIRLKGGPQKIPFNLIRAICKTGYEVAIFIFEKVENSDFDFKRLVTLGYLDNIDEYLNKDFYYTIAIHEKDETQTIYADEVSSYINFQLLNNTENIIYNAINGIDGGSVSKTYNHLLKYDDFECRQNLWIRSYSPGEIEVGGVLSDSKWGMFGYYGTRKERVEIETILKVSSENAWLLLEDDGWTWKMVNLLGNNRSRFFIFNKHLPMGSTVPYDDEFFIVNEAWQNATSDDVFKFIKNGSHIDAYVSDAFGWQKIFEYDTCNIVGFVSSYATGMRTSLQNCSITEYKTQYKEGLEDRIDRIEETMEGGGGSTDILKERFHDYKVLLIGDSITEKNFRATKVWGEYLNDWLSFRELQNKGMSGTGIVKPFQSFPSWYSILDSYDNDFDLILIMGDMNDWTMNGAFSLDNLGQYGDATLDTFYGTMKLYLEKLITKYPLAKIGWITSQPRDMSDRGFVMNGKTSPFYEGNKIIKDMCANYSIPVLDLYSEACFFPWNAAHNKEYFSCPTSPNGDGVHPNEKGQKIMAYKIYDFVVRNF